MKILVVFVCLCITVLGQDIESMKNMPKYDSRYDYLDVDALFNSKRLVRNYAECLVSGQRCTPEGKALKKLLPEALRTKCARCTERQKKIAVKIIKRLKAEYPEIWAKLGSKWDPTGDFTRYFEVFLANEQFNTINGNAYEEPSSPVAAPFTSKPLTTVPPSSEGPVPNETSPIPILLNRFGDDRELMVGSPTSAVTSPRPITTSTIQPSTTKTPPTTKPVPPRPTAVSWGSISPNTIPTRFTVRPTNELPLPYSTAITLIDQISIKIIRTTEIVTDILRNTVRAVIGR